MRSSYASSLIRLTKNHVPGVLRVPSLTRDYYVQPRPLKKTGRLTTQDISKALTLEGDMLVKNDRYIGIRKSPHALLAESAVWWHVPRGSQKLGRLLITCQSFADKKKTGKKF